MTPRADPRGAPAPSLLLASASPRRRRLLTLLGIPFDAVATDLDERPLAGEPPDATARRLAAEKARRVAPPADAWVLAADTVVVLDGRALGKPESLSEAAQMLRALRDRWHAVVTAVALRPPAEAPARIGSVLSRVRMRPYSAAEIDASIARGTPMDKAGAYAIQDERFRPVEALEGCYLNVVGLPLCEVARLLRASGSELPAPPAGDFQPPCAFCYAGARLEGIGGAALLRAPTP